MAQDPATIVFDARSDAKFQLLHVKGAKHLSLPDITADELAKLIPSKQTRILIYCNNNFVNGGAPTTVRITPDNPTGKLVGLKAALAFPGNGAIASLNISTYIALYGYGYKNVYELGPQLDPKSSVFAFESDSK